MAGMEHPSRPILAFVAIAATPVVLVILLQIRGILRNGELRREYPLPPLTRAKHPIVFWGIVGIGAFGAALITCVIAAATYWLVAP